MTSKKPDVKIQILEEALKLVDSARQDVYGPPGENFSRVASLWNAYLKAKGMQANILIPDVPMMLALLKIARLLETQNHIDSIVDIVGYILCYADVTLTPNFHEDSHDS